MVGSRRRRSARAAPGSKNAPMPVSSSIDPCAVPDEKAAARQRNPVASSGGIHFSHIAFGALPNIAPPSRRCELPRTEVRFARDSYHMGTSRAEASMPALQRHSRFIIVA